MFTSGRNLKSLLSQNKTKLLRNSYLGVYELKCTCNWAHFGETKEKISTRTIEHQQDTFKGNKRAKYNKKIRALNRNEGNLVKINTLTPLLANINEM